MTETDQAKLIDAIRRQEDALGLPAFDELAAHQIGERIRALALTRQAPVVIDIRTANRRLYFAALPGSTPDNDEWARRKGNTTLRCHAASLRVGLQLKARGYEQWPERGLDHKDYSVHGGAFPANVKGAGVVGVIAVSGLPSKDDHELVVAALSAHLGLSGLALT